MAEIFDLDPVAANNNSAPPNGFPEFMEYEEVNNSARELMAVIARFFQGSLSGVKSTAGTGTAYTLTSGLTFSAYEAGQLFAFVAHTTSTGPATLDIDGKGASNLLDSRGVQMGTGNAADIVAGGIYLAHRTSTAFRVLGHLSSASVAALGNVGARTPLAANRTYYVRADGNDANDGLADSAGGAFLTTQKAVDVVYGTLDLKGFDVDIQVRTGTFARAVVTAPQVGKGNITIRGDAVTPSNVVLTATGIGAANGVVDVRNGAILLVKDLTVQSVTSGCALVAGAAAAIYFQNIRFGATADFHLFSVDNAYIEATGNYSIVGGAKIHWLGDHGGVIKVNARTLTITGTPAFSSSFAEAYWSAYVGAVGNTYSGAATGKRFSANFNATIEANGGLTELPGNVAGVIATGGRHPALTYEASDAQIRSADSGVSAEAYITARRIETASAANNLTDAANVSLDWDASINFVLTLTADRILDAPANAQPGTWRTIRVTSNSGTARQLTFAAGYRGAGNTPLTGITNVQEYLICLFAVSATICIVGIMDANNS